MAIYMGYINGDCFSMNKPKEGPRFQRFFGATLFGSFAYSAERSAQTPPADENPLTKFQNIPHPTSPLS